MKYFNVWTDAAVWADLGAEHAKKPSSPAPAKRPRRAETKQGGLHDIPEESTGVFALAIRIRRRFIEGLKDARFVHRSGLQGSRRIIFPPAPQRHSSSPWLAAALRRARRC